MPDGRVLIYGICCCNPSSCRLKNLLALKVPSDYDLVFSCEFPSDCGQIIGASWGMLCSPLCATMALLGTFNRSLLCACAPSTSAAVSGTIHTGILKDCYHFHTSLDLHVTEDKFDADPSQPSGYVPHLTSFTASPTLVARMKTHSTAGSSVSSYVQLANVSPTAASAVDSGQNGAEVHASAVGTEVAGLPPALAATQSPPAADTFPGVPITSADSFEQSEGQAVQHGCSSMPATNTPATCAPKQPAAADMQLHASSDLTTLIVRQSNHSDPSPATLQAPPTPGTSRLMQHSPISLHLHRSSPASSSLTTQSQLPPSQPTFPLAASSAQDLRKWAAPFLPSSSLSENGNMSSSSPQLASPHWMMPATSAPSDFETAWSVTAGVSSAACNTFSLPPVPAPSFSPPKVLSESTSVKSGICIVPEVLPTILCRVLHVAPACRF